MIIGFGHSGITVSNLDRSVNFYCSRLGLRLLRIWQIGPEIISGFRDLYQIEGQASCKVALLEVPGNGQLELFEFSPAQPPEYVPWNRVGLTHLAILTNDASGFYAALSGQDITFCDNLARRPDGGQRFFLRDPDGNLIEIMEPFR